MNTIKRSSRAILIALLLTSSVLAGDWVKVETENFTLVGNASEKSVRKVGLKLEQFRKVLMTLLPKMKLNSTVPTVVYVFDSDSDFKPYKQLPGRKSSANIAGFFSPGVDANLVAISNDYTEDVFSRIIFHEYFHFAMEKNLKRAPVWLNEGLAEYYGSMEIDDNGVKFRLGTPIPSRVFVLRDRSLMNFQKLFSVNAKSPEYNKDSHMGQFYAQSWALVHFLMHGDNLKYRERFPVFIDMLINGKATAEEAFQKTYGVSSNKIEMDVDRYINRFTFPVIDYTVDRKIDADATFKSSPLSKQEELVRQGDLLLAIRQYEAASEKYNAVFKVDPNYSPRYFSLGKLDLRLMDLPGAKKNFEKAIELDPKNHLAIAYLAGMIANEGKLDLAAETYQKAIAVNPNVAKYHSSLGIVQGHNNNDRAAVSSFTKATMLEPREEDYFYQLSFALFRTGGRYQSALRAVEFINLAGWEDGRSAYAAMFAHLGYKSLAASAPHGDIVLKEALLKVEKDKWPYTILRYLNKEIDKDEFLRLADDKSKKTEAYTYVGLTLMLEKKPDEALEHFKWVRDNGVKTYVEYYFALREIDRIQAPSKT